MPRRQLSKRTILRSLVHTCDIEQWQLGDGTDSTQLGGPPGGDSYAAVVALASVPCLLEPLSQRESIGPAMEGAVVAQYRVLIAYRSILSASNAAATYRVINVEDSSSTVIDAGPLNIVSVENPGNMNHHLELLCTRQRIAV